MTLPQVFRHVPCTACGCVCDDLSITVAENKITSIENSCPIADEWFAVQADVSRPVAQIDGKFVSLNEAIAKAADILERSDGPLIYGLSRSNTPGQKVAVRLAADLGATIDTTASQCHGPSIMAIQEMGESTCTLGEVRNRADLVVFWGCNPAETHPRHAERYSVFPTGRDIPGGRTDRTVVMVGTRGEVSNWRLNRDGAEADRVIPVDAGRDFEVLTSLLSYVRGWPESSTNRNPQASARQETSRREFLVDGLLSNSPGVPIDESVGADPHALQDLAQRMKSCRYGIVFFGLGLIGMTQDRDPGNPMPGQHTVHLLLKLVAELNAHTRFFARRMRIYGDVTGADNVLCWQTGYPFGVNLGRGFPRYNPGEFTADDLLAREEVDACLLVGSETYPLLRGQSQQTLRRIPTIAVDHPGTALPFEPTVRITTAPCGLATGGTIYRMDGVPLTMQSMVATNYPTDADVLERVRRAIGLE